MPYLNWLNQPLKKPMRLQPALPSPRQQVELFLEPAHVQSLMPYLLELYRDAELTERVEIRPELRLVLETGWTLFLKVRSEGSRLLLAHPEENQWVVTIALDQACAKKWIQTLSELKEGSQLRFGDCGPMQSVTNIEVVVSL